MLSDDLIAEFLENSKNCVKALAIALQGHSDRGTGKVAFFVFENGRRREIEYEDKHFFLRTSTEYSNPQLNLEDLQGILVARILECSANYLATTGGTEITSDVFGELSEALAKPCTGPIIPFLLNTDDVEPDRYSVNPLRDSIVNSGQSAFPAANVSKDELRVDDEFIRKYRDSLVAKEDLESIAYHLENTVSNSYVDFVDAVKYDMLAELSKRLGIHLIIPALRMPVEQLKQEGKKGRLHSLIGEAHKDYNTVRRLYDLMGRNILKHKTLLPTVPHSKHGYGSKKAARGQLFFENDSFKEIKVKYRPTFLYPNEIDKSDLSTAKAHDDIVVKGDMLKDYGYFQTPSSPQFALYSTLSPEDASLWHGVGKYAGSEIIQSYASIHSAHTANEIFSRLKKPHQGVPIQFDLVAEKMLSHPIHNNIDSSVNCVENLEEILTQGTTVRVLSMDGSLRKITQ